MVRRPKKEYWLEEEAEKMILELENGAKLRILYFKAKNKSKETLNLVFYSGFISYVYIWEKAIEKLREKHDIYFIETREKEFSRFPKDEVVYNTETLAEDFVLVLKECKIIGHDLENTVFIGSSIASVAMLEAMGKYDINPLISFHSSPQMKYTAADRRKNMHIVGRIPYFIVLLIKPLIFFFYGLKFRKDRDSARRRKHTLARLLQPSQQKWMRKAKTFAAPYEVDKEALKKIKSPVIIIGAKEDPEHDEEEVQKLINLIPRSKFRKVKEKADTHNEVLAEIVFEELSKLRKK
ncbi:MAG: hypothetical protein K9W45_00965 [Candidatus Heimdallarchaeum aukensis]|uniref:Alpha/beta hydrolase n=1 Tax=Candidatus Heimdallarchaeum aukensis TaxID=2876573 RepID=A0A9Y1BLH1_9ARCH|nr:MAG: hypothetical protein K9W45_00965 [Candidatus Heimdallarchaeum aukensis]